VQARWAELRQVVDLFFVGPDHLSAVILDSPSLRRLALNDPQFLLQFVEQRADFADNKRKILAALSNAAGQGGDE